MENQVCIRWACPEDVASIVALCAAHAAYEQAHYDPAGKTEALTSCMFDQEHVKCLVVEVGEDIVGYASFMTQFSTWDASPYLYLDCLYLKSTVRNLGIGKRLMQKIMDYARAQGHGVIQWQTPDFNTRAIRFYERLGAKPKHKVRFFWEV